MADKTTTKMSLIGHNCKVEEKVKVTNSILMDNVTIKEGCQISGSLLCDGSVVQEGSVIKDCIVGKGFKFANGGIYFYGLIRTRKIFNQFCHFQRNTATKF